MKRELQFLLILFVPNIFSNPVEINKNEKQNKLDHEDNEDFIKNKLNFDISELVNVPVINLSKNIENEKNITTNLKPYISWLISPIAQKLQLSPQSILQNGLGNLKNIIMLINGQNITSKTLPTGLLQTVGFNEANLFYDNKEPVGLLGGNGWLANKGGILGGPGALLSTGSLFTDYPTAYKK